MQKYRLVKASFYGNEIRYILAYNDLKNFINAIKNYFISELDFHLYGWEHFESPTEDEKRRMESIFGKKEFKRVSTNSEIKLHEHKVKMRKCKNVDEYNDLFKLGTASFLEDAIWDRRVDRYKSMRKTKPRSQKEHRQDIQKYHEYLKKELDNVMERLPICCSDHNEIERFKMDCADVIQKYSFLYDLLNGVCPKIFETPNVELQDDIIRTEKSKQRGSIELARELQMIDLDLAYDFKNNRKIPIIESRGINPVTQRKFISRLFDLGF